MKKIIISAIAALVLALGAYGAYSRILPHPEATAEDYFAQYEKHTLTPDVEMQLRGLQEHFMNAFVVDFTMFEDTPPGMYRYPIAFTCYALACVAEIDPSKKQFCAHYMDKLIQKMKEKVVWEDWVKAGFGDDPVAKANIMYRGHLNLMYGLYQLTSGDTKYEEEYKAFCKAIHDEMKQTEKEGKYCGMSCEPDDYFVQCNVVGMYSLAVYDKLYPESNYSDVIDPWLEWTKKRMVNPDNGVFRSAYHMEHDYAEDLVSGYATGWSIAFLMALDPEFARSIYPSFKETFIHSKLGGMYSYATERPGGAPDPLATSFALFAASAMKDEELFTGLLNSVDKLGGKKIDGEALIYEKMPAPHSGVILFGKVNIGLEKLIAKKERTQTVLAVEKKQ